MVLVPDVDTVLDTDVVDTFEQSAPAGWLLYVPGSVFQVLALLEAAPGSLGWRARTLLRLLNRASTQPPALRRLWLDTDASRRVAETVHDLLSQADGALDVLVMALSQAEQLRCRPLLRRWGAALRLGGPSAWAAVTDQRVCFRSGGVMLPRRSFRERSQRNVVRGGYAGLAVLGAGAAASLWASLAPRASVWLLLAVCPLAVWLVVRLAHAGGYWLNRSRLARPLAVLDGGLEPRYRLVYWFGFVALALGTCGLSVVVLAIGRWLSNEA